MNNAKICRESDCSLFSTITGFCNSCSTKKLNIETWLCVSTCPAHLVTSGSQCICNTTSYFDSSFNLCRPCSDVDTQCTACTYDSTNKEGDCNTCNPPFAPTTDKRDCITDCTTYHANCDTCDATKCLTCTAGNNVLTAGPWCWATIPQCTTYNPADGDCTACAATYLPAADGDSCVTDCTTYHANCDTCDATKCLTCTAPMVVNYD